MFGLRTRCIVTAALVGTSAVLFLADGSAAASAAVNESTTCVSDNGSDVNAYFGIPHSDAIWLNLQGQNPACVTVVRGHNFIRTHGWIAQLPPGTKVNGKTIEPVYPNGYRPDHPAPMDDFLSKISRARYVVSRDGRVEITKTVTRRELLAHAKLGTFGDLFVSPDTTLTPGVTIYGAAPEWTTLEPFSSRRLGTGQHTIDIYWTLTKMHCDGFAPDITNDCFAAGETLSTSTVFNVVPHR